MSRQVIPSGSGPSGSGGDMASAVFDADASGVVDDTEAVGGTAAAAMSTDVEVTAAVAVHATSDGTSHANVGLADTHRLGSGADHANVALGDTHRLANGSDHSDVALNTTHRGSNGNDHSNVGLNNTHRASNGNDHSNVGLNNTHRASDGTDHANVVLNDTHRASDGSGHADVATLNSRVDQDVTIGSSPTLDGSNITGISGGDTFLWSADLSGTYDWQANGDGSQDPTSGIYAYEGYAGDVGDCTTLEVGTNKISFDLSADAGADRLVYLVARMDAGSLPDLRVVSSIGIRITWDLGVFETGTNNHKLMLLVANNDEANTAYTEAFGMGLIVAGGTERRVRLEREFNNASGSAQSGDFAAAVNDGYIWGNHTGDAIMGGAYETATNTAIAAARGENNGRYVRAGGANTPYFIMRLEAKNPSRQMSGSISAIEVRMS